MDAARRHMHHGAGNRPIAYVVAVLGVALGLFSSAFGPYYAILLGVVFAVAGMVVRRTDAEWGALLLALGIGLLAGALLYVVLGLLAQGVPGSASGTG